MIFKILQIAVPFVWFGLLCGISFLEAPLKFRAPGITLALGLGIGKLVFFWLNKIEIILAVLFLISLVAARPKGKFAPAAFGVIALLLVLQTVWLLPVLDARATAAISESFAATSNAHFVYIAFEVLKFILLPALGANLAKNYLKFE